MIRNIVATRKFAIYIGNIQLIISDFENFKFFTVCLAGNFPTHQNPSGSFPKNPNFWKNFVVDIQRECDIKVTGMSGPFQDEGEIPREVMLVFYNPQSQNINMRVLA